MNIIAHEDGWRLVSDIPVQDSSVNAIDFHRNQKLDLVVLADEPETPSQHFVGYVDSVSISVLSVITSTAFTGNAAIRIDFTDCIILAQVIFCKRIVTTSQLEGTMYIMGLELKEVFSRISQLKSLIRGLSGNPNS